MTFPGLDPYIHNPEDVKMIRELQRLNADLLEALKTIRIVSMGHGPLAHEIIEATCETAIEKARC